MVDWWLALFWWKWRIDGNVAVVVAVAVVVVVVALDVKNSASSKHLRTVFLIRSPAGV